MSDADPVRAMGHREATREDVRTLAEWNQQLIRDEGHRSKVEYTKRDMTAGVRPIVLDIAPNGAFAVVGSLAGAASGDSDSISLIDLAAKPPRVVDTIGVLGATAARGVETRPSVAGGPMSC